MEKTRLQKYEVYQPAQKIHYGDMFDSKWALLWQKNAHKN